MIDVLIEIIGKEAALFESFLELLEKQQRMLVENNLDGLNEITAEQHERLTESQMLNSQRIEIVEQIKKDKNIDGDLNITRLLTLIDRQQADRLEQLQNVILELNDKILETRNQNAILLNRSREYISKTMEMLARIHAPKSPTYGQSGESYKQNSTVAIDRRI